MPQYMPLVWLAAIVVFIVIEAMTAGLASIWFAAGSLVAMIAALLGARLWLQLVLFAVVSLAVIIILRPLAVKVLKVGKTKTNSDRLIGMSGTVIKSINNQNGEGLVRVGGQTWSAASENGETIEENTLVTVEKISGARVIVKKA